MISSMPVKALFISLILGATCNASAGVELICKGQGPRSAHRPVAVDCNDRRAFIDMLGGAWMTLRKNQIGGQLENLCWEAYKDAKGLHPSISFNGISDSFLARCNMGLAYIQ